MSQFNTFLTPGKYISPMYPEILIVILPSVDGTHLEIHGNTQERIIFFTPGKILFRSF